jgi:hypothetical protein
VKLPVSQPPAREPALEDAVRLLTRRYQVAYQQYQRIVDENAELNRTGNTLSEQALLDEERAFEELDVARHALLEAATQAYPTVH